jgi:hypothetical protein
MKHLLVQEVGKAARQAQEKDVMPSSASKRKLSHLTNTDYLQKRQNNFESGGEKKNCWTRNQGDQIGRIFAYYIGTYSHWAAF